MRERNNFILKNIETRNKPMEATQGRNNNDNKIIFKIKNRTAGGAAAAM
jgi:hypothetical protein